MTWTNATEIYISPGGYTFKNADGHKVVIRGNVIVEQIRGNVIVEKEGQ
jgi:hypothetical protein